MNKGVTTSDFGNHNKWLRESLELDSSWAKTEKKKQEELVGS